MAKQTPWNVKGIARINHTITKSYLNAASDAFNIQLNEIVDPGNIVGSTQSKPPFSSEDSFAGEAGDAPSPYAFGPGRWRSGKVAKGPAPARTLTATDSDLEAAPLHAASSPPAATLSRPMTSSTTRTRGAADSPQTILGRWQQMLRDVEKMNLEQIRQREELKMSIAELQRQIDQLQNGVEAAQLRVDDISETVHNTTPPSTLAIEQGVATTGRALMRLAARIEALEQRQALPTRVLGALKGLLTGGSSRRSIGPGSAR